MTHPSPFRYFKKSPEIIRLAVMMQVRFPLSLRNVENLLHKRANDICEEMTPPQVFHPATIGAWGSGHNRKRSLSKCQDYMAARAVAEWCGL